jgi:hypothetical protein
VRVDEQWRLGLRGERICERSDGKQDEQQLGHEDKLRPQSEERLN